MLHVATDASLDLPILSCGYVITESQSGAESFVDAGFRIMNTNSIRPNIDWCSSRGEYRALITGARAALDRVDEALMLYSDNKPVVQSIQEGDGPFEAYFHHALRSFVERFTDWHITDLDRERNEIAHEQARVGLKMGRKLLGQFD